MPRQLVGAATEDFLRQPLVSQLRDRAGEDRPARRDQAQAHVGIELRQQPHPGRENVVEVRRRFAGDAARLEPRQRDELAAAGQQRPLVDPGPIGQLLGQRAGLAVALRGRSHNGRHPEASSESAAISTASIEAGRLPGS